MTLTISLPPEDEKKLAQRAAASGKDVGSYVQQLIRRDIDQPGFAELLAPIHQAVRESGVSETELDSLLQSAVVQSREGRRTKKAP